jgi:nucleoside-diphosphate-sugar epimerase
MSIHVILGGNGVVGRETATALLAAGHPVASVNRSAATSPGVRSIVADLREPDQVRRALVGADVAYLTAGLPYRTAVWLRDWPRIMRATIDACLAGGIRLVYFDNVYAYGKVEGPMTEVTPIRPTSRKGTIRAELLRMLEAAAARGLDYTVGRSADFYGPGATTSVFNSMALEKIAAGRKPTWLLDATQPHSMTYTPDIGRALAVLGTDDRATGRPWHLPTAPALTGREYLALAGAARHTTMSLATLRMGAIFVPDAREALELSYQNTEPYLFDSAQFESTFGTAPTPYRAGITAALAAARR